MTLSEVIELLRELLEVQKAYRDYRSQSNLIRARELEKAARNLIARYDAEFEKANGQLELFEEKESPRR